MRRGRVRCRGCGLVHHGVNSMRSMGQEGCDGFCEGFLEGLDVGALVEDASVLKVTRDVIWFRGPPCRSGRSAATTPSARRSAASTTCAAATTAAAPTTTTATRG